jgi:hypothetical protein
MLRKVFIWGNVVFGCFLLTYGIWVLVAMNRTATISVDYVALLNEKAAAIPEGQRAWPLYREAAISIRKNPIPSEVFIEEDIEEPNWPDEAGWNHVHVWLSKHTSTLEILKNASNLKGMGYLLGGVIAEEDKELWPDEYASQQDIPPHDGFLVSILLPQLSPMRNMAKLLSADAKAAAAEGDANRCVEDVIAMLSIGTHTREHSLLIIDLVSSSVYNHMFSTLHLILDKEPDLFSDEQLEQLETDLSLIRNHIAIRFGGERMFVLDMLQRIYTDDGNGDGKIIPLDGRKVFMQLESVSVDSKSSSLLPYFLAPIADIYFASRKEMLVEYDRRLAYFEQAQDTALAESEGEYVFPVKPWVSSSSPIDPFFLMELLTPAYNSAVQSAVKTRNSLDEILKRIQDLRGIE